MAEDVPRAWLCMHCGEQVDPTMDLCWNCGHDREGVAHPTVFVEPVEVNLSHCVRCGYALKGNPDALHCPECGEPVPWQECPECGVRGSRAQMGAGCPACKAADTGRLFESVLDDNPVVVHGVFDFVAILRVWLLWIVVILVVSLIFIAAGYLMNQWR